MSTKVMYLKPSVLSAGHFWKEVVMVVCTCFCLYVGWGSFTGVILFDSVIMCTAGGGGGGGGLYKDVEVSDSVLKFSLKLLIGIFLL